MDEGPDKGLLFKEKEALMYEKIVTMVFDWPEGTVVSIFIYFILVYIASKLIPVFSWDD